MSHTSAEIDARLARYATNNESDREVLRRKVVQLVREFNGGEMGVRFGPFTFNIASEFEQRLRGLSDAQVKHALAILRE